MLFRSRPLECRGLVSNAVNPGDCSPTPKAARSSSKPGMYKHAWSQPVIQAVIVEAYNRMEAEQENEIRGGHHDRV